MIAFGIFAIALCWNILLVIVGMEASMTDEAESSTMLNCCIVALIAVAAGYFAGLVIFA